MDDLGKNTIFGFTETWLKMNDDIRFWEVRSENFQCFRKDRNLSLHDKTSGGGLLLYIPRSFKPKERSDLTYFIFTNHRLGIETLFIPYGLVSCNTNIETNTSKNVLLQRLGTMKNFPE